MNKKLSPLTDKQRDALLRRLQEYVDIGWNGGEKPLGRCIVCSFFRVCSDCPLHPCCPPQALNRRELLEEKNVWDGARIKAAREHAQWFLERCNAAYADWEFGLVEEEG